MSKQTNNQHDVASAAGIMEQMEAARLRRMNQNDGNRGNESKSRRMNQSIPANDCSLATAL
jgi:hypothetical protein